MAFCMKCGTQLAEGANFCAGCGTPAGAADQGNAAANKENVTTGGFSRLEENVTTGGFSRLDDTNQASGAAMAAKSGVVLASGQIIVLNGKNCTIEGQIKISGEAAVYKIKMDGKPFILKLYKPDMPLYDTTKEVLARIKNNPHERIIKVIDFGNYNGQDYEIMEFAEGGTLGECLKKGAIRDTGQLKSIVKMINEGLRQLHDTYNVIYQDLKPDNIYFKDAGKSQIVLADFGVSNVMETGEKKATVAAIMTRLYAASDLAAKTGQKYVIATPAADYFSLGITMFEMWLGETPFKGIPPVQRDYLISEESVDFPADMPSDYKALIQGLIKPNPKERWGDIQVQQWLAGQPLQGGKQTKVDNRVWNSKGGKACKTPEDIALALEAESVYYMEDLKNPNASLYQYFRDVEGAQGAEISEVFCKYFEEYPPEQALAMVCSMLKGA